MPMEPAFAANQSYRATSVVYHLIDIAVAINDGFANWFLKRSFELRPGKALDQRPSARKTSAPGRNSDC